MLNVAAYGIPKRSSQHPLHAHKTHTSASHHRAGLSTSAPVSAYPLLNYPPPTRPPHASSSTRAEPSLAVQVGEDAYFISDLAMGVADGVGGWSRHQAGRTNGSKSNGEIDHATPSALFARRLMHFCATEVETTSHLEAPSKPVDAASEHSSKNGLAETRPLNPEVYYPEGYDEYSTPFDSHKPDVSTSTFSNAPPSLATTSSPILEAQSSAYEDEDYSDEYDYPYDDYEYGCLDDALDDLSDGIDVLSILERAYEKTLSAHTQRVATAGLAHDNSTDNTHKEPPVTSEVPLMTGSSTALVAVLDCVKVAQSEDSVKVRDLQAVVEGLSNITITPSSQSAAADVSTSASATSSTITPPSIEITVSEPTADNDSSSFVPVIKLAHVGDCTAMLVRGEEIVWRSEEMWWDFNTPAQLGPTSPITPAVLKATVGSSGSASSSSLHERTSVDSEGISSRILESIPPSAWASSSSTASPIPQARPLSPLPAHPTTSPATTSTTPNTYSPLSTVHTPAAHLTTLPVQEDDILILASDGMADNLWDAEVLDEVVKFKHAYLAPSPPSTSSAASDSGYESDEHPSSTSSSSSAKPRDRMKRRSKSPRSMEDSRKLAAQLSEALCSRARRVSERKWNQPSSSSVQPIASPRPVPSFMGGLNGLRTPPVWHGASYPYSPAASRLLSTSSHSRPPSPPKEAEIPFGRRSKEYGRKWRGGGKSDDISVIVAVISPQ
ncbi:hypothetical protein ONZ45_g1776 [Pleurotus djamor]|nr:hypothetical protein ONZ45_g1776 [Pleurotus djamor]